MANNGVSFLNNDKWKVVEIRISYSGHRYQIKNDRTGFVRWVSPRMLGKLMANDRIHPIDSKLEPIKDED